MSTNATGYRGGPEPEYLQALNPRQKEAVVHSGPPLLILAGAGSGKTRVITTKIAYLVQEIGVDPRSILAVTFTNKAAQEMKERVLSLAPRAEHAMVRTFHSFGAWFLRRNAALAGLAPDFRIYDEDDSVSLLKGILGSTEDRGFLRRTLEEISRVKDLGVGPDDPAEDIERAGCAPDLYASYEKAKRRTANVDFGDLILMPLQILRRHAPVRQRTRQRFRVVLVDEYQDSNVAQFELLKELWEPGVYLCVVGDDDQSIYRFRGAEVGNIISFPTVFPGTQVVKLEQNYRSTQAILDAASAVVANNRGRLGKTLWTEKAGGELPTVSCLEDQDAEAELCAAIARDGFEGTTAILYRMNAQSLQFEKRFREAGIRFRLVGTVRFYAREEVKDALAYLSLLVNRNDEVSFRRVVNRPSRGIGAASVEKLVEAWRDRAASAAPGSAPDLLDSCRRSSAGLSARARSGLAGFLSCLEELGARRDELPLGELARALLARTGLYEMYRVRDRSDDTDKTSNLEEMVSDMSGYGAGAEALTAFLESVALASPLDTAGANEEAQVTLITLHNTKGLEFDRVIITGLEDGIFPHDSSLGTDDDIEEERRLFYVGITRARERLAMTWCRRRRLFGRTVDMAPSRFLGELPDEMVEREEDSAGGEEEFAAGTGVYHEEYGTGVVERTWYTDGSLVVQVRFQTGRVGKFLPKYARLERVELD